VCVCVGVCVFARVCITLSGNSAVSWNYYGLCENAIGQTEKAIKAYSKSISLDPSFKEGWTNMAQVHPRNP